MSVESVATFRIVFESIDNGIIFEQLAKDLMSAIRGTGFKPLGGFKDKGMDGLEYVWTQDGSSRLVIIHQFSIQKDVERKVRETIQALRSNEVDFDRLVYGTNGDVKNQYEIMERMHSSENAIVEICDSGWFESQLQHNRSAVVVFNRFARENVRPSATSLHGMELVDFIDPRIYVYLRQNLQSPDNSKKLDEMLIDTLIFRALEDTDPDREEFRTKSQILDDIQSFVEFDTEWLEQSVSRRLRAMSSKPGRLIRHHQKEDYYCLPYETRVELAASLLKDAQVYEEFKRQSTKTLKVALSEAGVRVRNGFQLLEATFRDIYKMHGLEFSQFIQDGDGADKIDKSLSDIIDSVVEGSQVTPKNRKRVKTALIGSVRDIVYNGSEVQLEFLSKLSSTYLLLFLLQYDPKVVSFFESIAEQLEIYVDTSILVPAMSEYFLDTKNQRYSNLLKSASGAGVKLYVTHTVLSELSSHFKHVDYVYRRFYLKHETLYEDPRFIRAVPEILLRAYYYAKSRAMVSSYEEFFRCYASFDESQREDNLFNWIHDSYGVSYVNDSNLDVSIDPYIEEELYEKLKDTKNSPRTARNDVKQLLMIYAIRDKNNEFGDKGAFGYRTWWLTSDTNSQRAFSKISDSGNHRNPYMRADFLYNFLTLGPSRSQVDATYNSLFPSLLGVNISFHIPDEIGNLIREQMVLHAELVNRPGFKGRLSLLLEELMSSPTQTYRHKIDTWFEQWKN